MFLYQSFLSTLLNKLYGDKLSNHHIEELLQKQVDKNKIIIKKNKNGKIVDIIFGIKEKKIRIYNINISLNNVLKITKFIGKIVCEYNYEETLKIWNNRSNIETNVTIKKEHFMYKLMVLQLILE